MQSIPVAKTPSHGIAMGKAYLLNKQTVTVDTSPLPPEAADSEWALFQSAAAAVAAQLRLLAEGNDIFSAHVEVAEDVVLQDAVEAKIREECKRAPLALREAVAEIMEMFAQLDNEYLRERAIDIRDVGRRILLKMLGLEEVTLSQITQPSIIIAQDLAPSDMVTMNALVKGFVTKVGGTTSHVVIIAQSMGLPAAVDVGNTVDVIANGDDLILDCNNHVIVVNPDEQTIATYASQIALIHR